MAFYEDKREHYGGAIVLFKRNLAVAVPNATTHRRANWYMRLKIGGRKGYVTRSTKLTIYEDAYWFELELSIAEGKQRRRIEWIN